MWMGWYIPQTTPQGSITRSFSGICRAYLSKWIPTSPVSLRLCRAPPTPLPCNYPHLAHPLARASPRDFPSSRLGFCSPQLPNGSPGVCWYSSRSWSQLGVGWPGWRRRSCRDGGWAGYVAKGGGSPVGLYREDLLQVWSWRKVRPQSIGSCPGWYIIVYSYLMELVWWVDCEWLAEFLTSV